MQARRWTLGAAEVFHYFMVKSSRIPLLTAASWGASFLLYYGILLCCSHLYGFTLALSSSFILPEDAAVFGSRLTVSQFTVYISLLFLYLTSASMFVLDRLSQRLLVPRPEERISLVRNVFHLVLAPVVMLGYR